MNVRFVPFVPNVPNLIISLYYTEWGSQGIKLIFEHKKIPIRVDATAGAGVSTYLSFRTIAFPT